jgi:hypothetical protein
VAVAALKAQPNAVAVAEELPPFHHCYRQN